MKTSPEGATQLSPALQRWDETQQLNGSPGGTTEVS